jgi:hypothetical protein
MRRSIRIAAAWREDTGHSSPTGEKADGRRLKAEGWHMVTIFLSGW